MSDDVLIAKQTRRITELEEELTRHKKAWNDIYDVIYCIGGPLNDNKLGYTKLQQWDFNVIANLLP